MIIANSHSISQWCIFSQVQKVECTGKVMSWWRFWEKPKKRTFNDPLLKDGRMWLSELRNICEMNFDNPEEAKRQIRQMQVEWNDSFNEGTISKANKEGLEGRAYRLLTCNDNEWITWLDDLDFWKMGWKPVSNNEDKV
tara:strand:- start:141 stop:557 length:417 start_codon:yes stop_codon:yes gene_type:complete